MRSFKSFCLWIYVVMCAFMLLDQRPAHAYLDPGTGSYVFQAVLAMALSGLVALKLFWKKILGFIKRTPPEDSDYDEDE